MQQHDGFLSGLRSAFARALEAGTASDRRATERETQRAAGWDVVVRGLPEPWRVQASSAAAAFEAARRKFGDRVRSVSPGIVWGPAPEDVDNAKKSAWRERSEVDDDDPRGVFG